MESEIIPVLVILHPWPDQQTYTLVLRNPTDTMTVWGQINTIIQDTQVSS